MNGAWKGYGWGMERAWMGHGYGVEQILSRNSVVKCGPISDRVRNRVRVGGFMSNESVTEYHGIRHYIYTISLWCTFPMPSSMSE